jgi:hypothetical protein
LKKRFNHKSHYFYQGEISYHTAVEADGRTIGQPPGKGRLGCTRRAYPLPGLYKPVLTDAAGFKAVNNGFICKMITFDVMIDSKMNISCTQESDTVDVLL